MREEAEQKPQKKGQAFHFSLDLRIVVAVLLLIIAAMLVMWKPWSLDATNDARTVEVVGDATVTAEPDEFVFYPSYEFENANKDAALEQMSAKSTEITTKLKELGVEDNDMKTSSDGYDKYYISPSSENGATTYTLRIEVKTTDKERAQQIQDYLVTTAPAGQVSPQAQFSEAKRKELESQARDEATKDARAKADQSAKNLGFTIGKVKSVKDGVGFGEYPVALERGMAIDADAVATSGTLTVQPGENELHYTVSVAYYLK